MTYDEVKNAPLNVLVGYLVTVSESDCPCMCKWEANQDCLEHENTLRIYADHIRDDCKKDGEYDTCPQRLAYERVMEAVEKQMPKKPIRKCGFCDVEIKDDVCECCGRKYRKHEGYFVCPTCGNSASTKCGYCFEDYRLDFCNHCGQAFDNSEYWGSN